MGEALGMHNLQMSPLGAGNALDGIYAQAGRIPSPTSAFLAQAHGCSEPIGARSPEFAETVLSPELGGLMLILLNPTLVISPQPKLSRSTAIAKALCASRRLWPRFPKQLLREQTQGGSHFCFAQEQRLER
jgi:hypothetical protein